MTTAALALASQAPATGSWTFDDDAVRFAIDVLDATGIVASLHQWRAEERERLGRHAGGAPERFPADALMVAMLLAAIHHRPLHLRTFRDILFRHISPAMRAQLGVPDPPDPDDRLGWEALERCVRTRFHGLLEVIDPSPLPKNRILDAATFDAEVAQHRADHDLTDDVLDQRMDRLGWVANQILEASVSHLPRELRRRWKGSVVVDATNVPAFARQDVREKGKQPREQRKVLSHSADPDAGLYVRTDDDPTQVPGAKPSKTPRKARWAYEASLIVTAAEETGTGSEYPALVIGMAPLHRPASEPGKNATVALASVQGRGHPAKWLAGDRAYTHALADDFQLPARAMGYDVVLDYRADQLGIQGSYSGALMIEGAWYSPGIPQTLIDATIDYRSGKIDETMWKTRIEARRAYRLRVHEQLADGQIKMMCPAAHLSPTARCELKPASEIPKTKGKTRIHVTDALRANPPKICEQQTVNFPPDAGAKLWQPLQFGSPEWADTYYRLRNTIEGINGTAKDGSHSALDDPERRRVRGVAAQTIFTALLLFATNLQKIASFVAHAVVDSDGVTRRPRKSRRTSKKIQTWTPAIVGRGGAPPP